jgi:hypothetical protein
MTIGLKDELLHATPPMTFKATILLPNTNEGVNSTLVESYFMFNFNFNFNIDP